MRRYRVLGVVLIATVISSSTGSSVGNESRPAGPSPAQDDQLEAGRATTTISDPEDVEACPEEAGQDCPIDIRAVSKRRFTTATGRKMLAFSVDSYELYVGLVYVANIKLPLDTRAGPRSDTQIFMAITDLPGTIGWRCGREWDRSGHVSHRYRFKKRGDRLTCFVPKSDLHPTKRIRFKALSRATLFVVDRAPDNGWGDESSRHPNLAQPRRSVVAGQVLATGGHTPSDLRGWAPGGWPSGRRRRS